MLRAVPATMDIAERRVKQLRSGILDWAISLIWSQVTVATFLRFGSPDPEEILAASFRDTATGGCLTSKEKDLSLKTVMTTGRTLPA